MHASAFATTSRLQVAGVLDPVPSALRDHVAACERARGRDFELRCLGEWLHGLLGPRFFTTVFGATVLMTLLAGCV